jgi:ribonucleoside-triphosphate reductase (thioredoxin)
MISCKAGNWWELNPQRGRANNSAVLMRHKVTKEFFLDIWKRVELSGAGEPGIYFSNDKDWGTNPCCEIALRPFQFCNLCEVNASDIESQEDLNERVKGAAFIGTLQAGYTDFHYLREEWRETTEKDALIGVSMTGIGSGTVLGYDMTKSASLVKRENTRVAKLIGINPAARCTTVKPAGTTSLTLGTSSGIHAWHNDFYIRRIRVGKNESIYKHLAQFHPELVQDEYYRPHDTAVIEIPQKSPTGAILRTESPFDLLDRVKKVSQEWVNPGHRKGSNTHNVSATISLKENDWDLAGEWMWENRKFYNGLSVLPYDGGTYVQAPFEDIDEEKYFEMMDSLLDIDLSKIIETEDNTDLSGELACAGGACEIDIDLSTITEKEETTNQ